MSLAAAVMKALQFVKVDQMREIGYSILHCNSFW